MPKGNPSKQTIASAKYQKKAGYIAKSFKIKKETADRFTEACEKAGVSQAAMITKLMNEYSKSVEERDR